MRINPLLKHNTDHKLIDNVHIGKSLCRPFLFGSLNVTGLGFCHVIFGVSLTKLSKKKMNQL